MRGDLTGTAWHRAVAGAIIGSWRRPPRPDEADDRLPIERAAPERRSEEEAAAEAVPRHPTRRSARFTEALDRITAEDGELLRRLAGR